MTKTAYNIAKCGKPLLYSPFSATLTFKSLFLPRLCENIRSVDFMWIMVVWYLQ